MTATGYLRNLLTTGKARKLSGFQKQAVDVLAIIIFVFQLWALLSHELDQVIQISLFACGTMALTFLIRTGTEKSDVNHLPVWDLASALICLVLAAHFALDAERLVTRWPEADPLKSYELVLGFIFILLVVEACRRCVGTPMTLLVVIGILYVLYGYLIPGILNHRPVSIPLMIDQMVFTENGIMSAPMKVAATICFSLVAFGLFFERSGGGKFFNSLSAALVGKQTGGAAKATVITGALFGMISGSPSSDSVLIGSFAVPMMKKEGYSSVFAGGVTALAATGGAVMPPVLSAAAFLMAELTGISYVKIALAAVIPGLLYFVCNLMQVHLYSLRNGFTGLKGELPRIGDVLRGYGHFSIPILALVGLLLVGYPVVNCGLGALAATWIISWFRKDTRLGVNGNVECIARVPLMLSALSAACAGAGIIVGAIMMTGIGGKAVSLINMLSGDSVFLALVIAAVICIVLGMGMPLISVYILVAVLVVPALIAMGVPVMQAHLFVIYYSALSAITPPVAVAAFAVAPIAEDDPFAIGWRACRLGLVVFLVPFIFAYEPVLILEGDYSIPYLLLCISTAIIGTGALAIGVEGYLRQVLSRLERLVFLSGGIFLLIPGVFTDFIGFILIAAALVWHFKGFKARTAGA